MCIRDRYWPVLTALEGNQSVIEEHFTDENILEMADLMIFITGEDPTDKVFHLEDLEPHFIQPLRDQLVQAGITLELESAVSDEEDERE